MSKQEWLEVLNCICVVRRGVMDKTDPDQQPAVVQLRLLKVKGGNADVWDCTSSRGLVLRRYHGIYTGKQRYYRSR